MMPHNQRFVLQAGPHDRKEMPASARFALEQPSEPRAARLVDETTGFETPCQAEWSDDGKGVTLWWILDDLPAGAERAYTVEWGTPSKAEAPSAVTVAEASGKRIALKIGSRLFTYYHFHPKWARPFLHPVVGPAGRKVTRNWPIVEDVPGETNDHKHHKSIYTAHGDVNGTDNWSEEEGHAWQIHQRFGELLSGPVFGCLCATNAWVAADKQTKLLEEDRCIRVFGLGGNQRLVDFDITFRMTDGDVRFGDTKEGGILSIRVASSMDGTRGGKIENSYGGLMEAETWGKRAAWCDYSGDVGGKLLGIAVMEHPLSYRFPTYWHVRNYGLMTANPFGLSHFHGDTSRDGSVTIPQGQAIRFRYRLYIHNGDARKGRVSARYHDYVNPPQVRQPV